MKLSVLSLALVCLTCAGCLDFVEPLPPATPDSTHASLYLSAYQESDSTISISAQLSPGIDENGQRRTVSRETLIAFGVPIMPARIEADSMRFYYHTIVVDAVSPNFNVDPPVLNGLVARPLVQWVGVRKMDPDTIRLQRGADLVLHIETGAGNSNPEPAARSWALDMGNSTQHFRFAGIGHPPATLTVPWELIPVSTDSVVFANVSITQYGAVTTPHYAAEYNYQGRMTWTIIVR